MKFKRDGVLFELEKIKDYPRFRLYQVYRIKDNKRIPVYKECYTDLEIINIFIMGGVF